MQAHALCNELAQLRRLRGMRGSTDTVPLNEPEANYDYPLLYHNLRIGELS